MLKTEAIHSWLDRHLLEPYSALTHLIGSLGAAAGFVILVAAAWGQTAKLITLVIYGLSQVLLYTASTVFHAVQWSGRRRMWLNRLDHVAIFLLIAGTYTPLVFNSIDPPWRGRILLLVWSVALAGSLYKLLSARIHGLINATIYLLLGWGGAMPVILGVPIQMPPAGHLLIIAGGLVYTVGFLTYYQKWPDPWPGVFGHHEIWHLFVLGGGFFHFLAILLYVVPPNAA